MAYAASQTQPGTEQVSCAPTVCWRRFHRPLPFSSYASIAVQYAEPPVGGTGSGDLWTLDARLGLDLL
jgi:hypothetical protein